MISQTGIFLSSYASCIPCNEKRVQLTEKDSQLLTYAALNIASEMSWQSASYVHTIDLLDGSFAVILILQTSSSMDEPKKRIQKLGDEMLLKLREVLQMPATLVVNGPTSTWTDVPYLLEQARRALSYRTFNSESQLLEASVVLDQTNQHVEFPYDLEQEFTHTLNLGLNR